MGLVVFFLVELSNLLAAEGQFTAGDTLVGNSARSMPARFGIRCGASLALTVVNSVACVAARVGPY